MLNKNNFKKQFVDQDRKILFTVVILILLAVSLVVSIFGLLPKIYLDKILQFFSVIGVAPVVWRALGQAYHKRITVDALASIAVIATLLNGQYLSAVFINLMLASAELFDLFTQKKTNDTISLLLKLRPSVVKKQEGETIKIIPIDDVKVGDKILLDSGDRVPIDGVVLSGTAGLDQSSITGESALVEKSIGSKIYSATLVENGSLVVLVEKVGEDTTLSKMISLVDEASREKTKTETIMNRFSTWYVFFVFLMSGVVYLLTQNISMVLGILLVTCADDIAVAIPLGFTVAIAKAARHGIIIKGGTVLENLNNINIFVADKTGTLTKGKPKITGIEMVGGIKKEELLHAISITVANSKHSVSRMLENFLKENNVPISVPDDVNEMPGFGIIAKKDGREYTQGNMSYLLMNKIDLSQKEKDLIKNHEENGESFTFLASDGGLIGLVFFEDEIRPNIKEAIIETKKMGIKKWVMLTGDNEFVAKKIGDLAGIDSYYSNLKPEDKLHKIKEIKKEDSSFVAMVGDGVNDAPALASADVSFAMGAIGSDVAIETSDVALMHDDWKRIPETILLSKESMRIIKQNFFIWIFSNVVGLSLVFGGIIGPVGASVFNFLTDFLPIMNVFQIWFLKINKHSYTMIER